MSTQRVERMKRAAEMMKRRIVMVMMRMRMRKRVGRVNENDRVEEGFIVAKCESANADFGKVLENCVRWM